MAYVWTRSRKYKADIHHKATSIMNNSVKHSPSREAEASSASQVILRISRNPKIYHGDHENCYLSLFRIVCFQMNFPGPRLFVLLRDVLLFHGKESLASRSTSEMEDHPLSAVPQQLIEYKRNYPSYLETVFSIRNLTTHHR
jgi:hypothetical protein